MVVAKSVCYFSTFVFLAMAGCPNQVAAQEQLRLCEQAPVNAVIGARPKECFRSAQPRPTQTEVQAKGCCATAPEGPREKCFADEFQLVLPLPNLATELVLSANGALVIGPRSSVRTSKSANGVSAFGEVSNLGEANTFLGEGANVGSLLSNAKVTLGEGVTVNGSLTAGGALIAPSSASLKGTVKTNMPISAVVPPLATVKFSPEPAIDVSGGSNRTLAPGRYGDTRVDAGGMLALTPGTYYMTSLTVLAGGTLALDEKAGAIVVFVKSRFVFAGNERQGGSDGHVLIAAFGCEPSLLSAPFRGTVSAQNGWLSMVAPAKETFAGRFFANSIEVGADTTVAALGLTLPNGPSQVSGGPPPSLPAPLPAPPPPVAGCYEMTPNGWRSVPCATQEFIDSHIPHPDAQLGMNSFVSTPSLVYGQVEVTVPQAESEQDAFSAETYAANSLICPPSLATTPNQWSVQNNANGWTLMSGPNAGDTVSAQFTIQSSGSTNAICIYQNDITNQTYSHTCYSPPSMRRAGGLQAFDFGNIATTVAGGMLEMVARLSWVAPGQPDTYAVVAPDTNGLKSNWSYVGGGLIGFGGCSQAQFTNAEVVTQVAASTCAGDTTGTSPTCAPPTLQPNESAVLGSFGVNGTKESNNLAVIGSPIVAYPNSDLAITSITATTTGGCLGHSQAYVKDSVNDFGATPSTLGNAVFWESPDIFLVPYGAPVDLNAVSTETTITPGGKFDIWVRVHNDVGCSDVNNVKALVYLADPSALSVQWNPVTGGQYVGNNGSSAGVTLPANGDALIGPLTFTAPTSGIGNGHRCILAAIEADGEPAPANYDDAPDSSQVGQRNVQFSSPCVFPLTNATTLNGSAQITLTAIANTGPTPSLTAFPDVEASFDDADSSWFNAWTSQTGNGSTFKVTHSGATTTVRLGTLSVALNSVPLLAGQSRNATANINLGMGSSPITLQISATLTETNGSGTVMVQNGGSCVQQPRSPIQ